jgi:hypothetical protein
MGRLEKIVVLTVLFLVAVVLGVALNSDGPNAASGARASKEDPAKESLENPGKVPGLLNAGTENEPIATPERKPEVPSAPEVLRLRRPGPNRADRCPKPPRRQRTS